MSNFCPYLANGEVYNRKRSIVSVQKASCFFAVRSYHKQNTVYLNYQDQTRRNIKNAGRSSCEISVTLADVTHNRNVSTDFSNNPKYEIL